ncbi:T-cell activation Rho GTPase-activating protein [Hyla sarda]|uniref:T-cell activation Rho GTPase-activating protein n=1 Tax=Hyla sarda TaxID=327740 RepID=UPI0024C2FC8F|nr:T-cell activation Rho GTPase-activating protein [Hyla sarda]
MSLPHPRNKARRGSDDGILHNKAQHKSLAQRRCSAPSLVFPKSLSKPWSTGRENSGCSISIEQCPFVLGLSNEDSELILHECVQLTQDFKTKERYLFLFSDMIIIAKLKSGTSFRLKHRVDLSQMMVLSCDEDEENTWAFHSSPKNALIFIWHNNGCIASFRSCEVKELWLDTLVWQIREVGGIEGTSVPCAGLLMKVLTGCNASKALVASNMDTLIECHTEADGKKYQLLAEMIGEEGICHTIESNKKRKTVLSWPFTFRRSSTLSGSSSPPELKATLFNQPLSIVCEEDNLPQKILDILAILKVQGLKTEGIFRKAANEKARKELKDDLNYGKDLDLKNKSVHLLAVVFKDFLRGIPNQLLSSELYNKWMCALEKQNLDEKIEEMKCVAEKLPKPNLILLRYLICVLHHISEASDINKMDSRNLAVCIAPTMLVPQVDKNLPLETQKELNEKVTALVEFFIDHCFEIFGENISQLIDTLEQDSLETIHSPELSFHHNDSAYESTDPDHECNAGLFIKHHCGPQRHSRSEKEESTLYDVPISALPMSHFITEVSSLDRRCSEPFILPSQNDMPVTEKKLTRSHDDVAISQHNDKLSAITPEYYCDRALYRRKMPKGLKINSNYDPNIIDDCLVNASSNCSLDSSCSDCSVFTSSPLASPLSPPKRDLLRHKSLFVKNNIINDLVKPVREIKKHSNSFCYVNHKKMVTKTQSWGPDGDNAGGLQRDGLSQSFRYRSQAECNGSLDTTFHQPQVVRKRCPSGRKISVEEVFRMVDQRNPGKPPSYEEAVHKTVTPYSHSVTVQTMRDSVSNNDCLTPYITSRPSADSMFKENSSHKDNRSGSGIDKSMDGAACELTQSNCEPERMKVGLVRTKSESTQKKKHECVSRRCSQPIFEINDQIQYAKESYV